MSAVIIWLWRSKTIGLLPPEDKACWPLGSRVQRSLSMFNDVSSCAWFCVPLSSCAGESVIRGDLTSTACLPLLTLNHQTVLPVLAFAFLTCQACSLLQGKPCIHACVIPCVTPRPFTASGTFCGVMRHISAHARPMLHTPTMQSCFALLADCTKVYD